MATADKRVRVVAGGIDLGVPAGRPGALLRVLLAHPNEPVPATDLAASLWPGAEAPEAARRLRVVASRLRRQLPAGVELRSREGLYCLNVSPATLDHLAIGSIVEATAVPLLARPRLLDRLPPAGSARLIALTAPSGYGKTVLLRQWAQREPRVTWVTAGSGRGAADDALTLVDALARLPAAGKGFGIVIDDLENVTDPDFHARVGELMRLGPSELTIAVASRQSLPFRTARLQASGEIVFITAADLAFTSQELVALVPTAAECEAGSPEVDACSKLMLVTRGWPEPALAIAPAAADDYRLDQALDHLAGASGFLDRVLRGVPPDFIQFMIASADLDPLDADLCDFVCERTDSASVVSVLATRHHLLERTGTRFRHHPLLAELLRRADAYRIAALERHRRAHCWYRKHDRPDRALQHAASAGEPTLVASTLAPAIHRAAASADAGALERWARTIPLGAATDRSLTDLGVLAAALLPADRRARWDRRAAGTISRHISSTALAVDHLRAGRCHAALQCIERARRPRPNRVPSTTSIVHTVLSIAEAECHLLLTASADEVDAARVQRDADAAPWPWLTTWAFGVGAVEAYFSGDAGLAAAMLDHADARYRRLRPASEPPPRGWAALTRALLQLDSAEGRAHPERICTRVERIVSGADALGHEPLGVVARYVLSRARGRAGDPDAAAVVSAADRGLRRHPDLQLLPAARAQLVERRSPMLATTAAELSPRERTVLAYLASDLTLAEIAEQLFVSVHTIRTQVRSIYRKLGVTGRAQAVSRVV